MAIHVQYVYVFAVVFHVETQSSSKAPEGQEGKSSCA